MFVCRRSFAGEYQGEPAPWHLLKLGQLGHVCCLVDLADLSWIGEHAWNYHYKHWYRLDTLYARRNVGASRKTIYLHREIMRRAEPRSERFIREHVVDHISGQTLDNRRCNLRWATTRQNNMNRHIIVPTLEEIMAANPNPPDIEIPF